MHAFDFILVLFSLLFVCRDLVASRRRQHTVFGRRRLKLIAIDSDKLVTAAISLPKR
jgi:hypothetical protein